MIYVISYITGEILATFPNRIWFADDKRFIRRWVKNNGYVEVKYEAGSLYVATLSDLIELKEIEQSEV